MKKELLDLVAWCGICGYSSKYPEQTLSLSQSLNQATIQPFFPGAKSKGGTCCDYSLGGWIEMEDTRINVVVGQQ